MGKKTDKLQRIIKKMAIKYGEEDEDVRRLQSTMLAFQSAKSDHAERRRFGPTETRFMTPAKQLFYDSKSESTH